jgi:prevent-host-death family protein
MKSVSAKELKNHTGKILRQVGSGEKVLITKRGKPCAVLSPLEDGQLRTLDLRPFEEAWRDIEQSLRNTRPHYKTWQEALRWTRRRG